MSELPEIGGISFLVPWRVNLPSSTPQGHGFCWRNPRGDQNYAGEHIVFVIQIHDYFFCKFHGPFSLPDKLFVLDLPYEVMIGSKILQLKNN